MAEVIKILKWGAVAVGALVGIGSNILDAFEIISLGLPNSAWTAIGFALFTAGIIGIVIGFQKERQTRKVGISDTEQQEDAKGKRETQDWLQEVLSSDLERIYKGMRGRATRWDFSGIYNREPYFDVFVELTNTTIFTFSLKGVSGFMKIAGEQCINPPHVSARANIERDCPADIRIRQPIASETSSIIQDAGGSDKEIQFDLGGVIFEIENTTEGYEKYKPYLHGGQYGIVPKDGLKIEDKIDIDVRKHLIRKIEKQGYFPIDVEFTLEVPNLPIQLAKVQLCIADEVIDPITVNPPIPKSLEARVETYMVKYEPLAEQVLKGRGTILTREEELKLMLPGERWKSIEYKAHLRLRIGDEEIESQEFIFDFESSRS